MLECDYSEECKNERAAGELYCYKHYWGEYTETPRRMAESLFGSMDVVTQDSSMEVGLIEYVLTEAEKRGMDGKLPFAMRPIEIYKLEQSGKQAQEAFGELTSQMEVVIKRLTSTLNRFHASMAECGVIKEQMKHGPVYLIKKLQEQGILPKVGIRTEEVE